MTPQTCHTWDPWQPLKLVGRRVFVMLDVDLCYDFYSGLQLCSTACVKPFSQCALTAIALGMVSPA